MKHTLATAATIALFAGTAAASAATPAPPSWGCPTAAASTVTCVNGGGSTSSTNAYIGKPNGAYPGGELYQYANANPAIGFAYESSPGSAAQSALKDNLPSEFNGVTSETGYSVHFAASDSYIDSKSPLFPYVGAGHPLPGNGGQFIQIPMFVTASTIPISNAKMVTNGSLTLTDNDLCGIFSGLLTDWSKTSVAARATAGTIHVYWRNDNAGSSASFVLTQHLAAVCTTSNTKAGITFKTTTKFASLFPNVVAPPNDGSTAWTIPVASDGSFGNFVGAKGSSGVADGVNNDATKSAIGYVSPDYTAIAKVPATSSKTKQYTSLFVASLVNKNDGTAYLPTVVNLNTAMSNPGSAVDANPPALTVAAASVQTNWVPQITTPAKGYPIIAYSNWLTVQCFANANVANAIIGLLTKHLNGAYTTALQDSGFVPTLGGAATGFGAAVNKTFLTNLSGLNLNIQNAKACTGITKR